MKISELLSDEAIIGEFGRRIGAARLERNLTQDELARQAGISKRTLERIESGAVAAQLSQLIRVLRALNMADRLDQLIPEAELGPVAMLRIRQQRRQRATGQRKKRASRDVCPAVDRVAESKCEAAGSWTWGDDT